MVWFMLAVTLGGAAGTMAPLPSMRIARMAHSATALPDGRILVAGGFGSDSAHPASAELFDPATSRFLPATAMRTTRYSHTATALADGRILFTGGYGPGGRILRSAELYDPATGRFVDAGALTEPRADHVAVRLADGRVLIAGGMGPDWTYLASAELYDPVTGRSSRVGDMTVPRESHVGVRLANGQVLVVGGHVGRRSAMRLHASAELYDPATATFRRTGDMATPRHKHDAVRVADGRVLVTGGADLRDSDGQYDSTEWYDPATGRFTQGPRLQRPRYKHARSAVLLRDGRLLVAGGATAAETWDPATGRFTIVPGAARLPANFSAVAALADGRVLVTGGYGPDIAPQRGAWIYQP